MTADGSGMTDTNLCSVSCRDIRVPKVDCWCVVGVSLFLFKTHPIVVPLLMLSTCATRMVCWGYMNGAVVYAKMNMGRACTRV